VILWLKLGLQSQVSNASAATTSGYLEIIRKILESVLNARVLIGTGLGRRDKRIMFFIN